MSPVYDERLNNAEVFYMGVKNKLQRIMKMLVIIPFSLLALGASVNAYCQGYEDASAPAYSYRHHLIQGIRHLGGEVIVVGRTVKIVIPTAQLFRGGLANLYYYNMRILNKVAKYLNTFSKMNVKIAAYSGYYISKSGQRYLKLLTTKQAQEVQQYLWRKRTDTRLMYAVGYGIRYPVAKNWHYRGRYYNSRIEISFRYYIDRVL